MIKWAFNRQLKKHPERVQNIVSSVRSFSDDTRDLLSANMSRAAAMLTHISLMIALTGILWSLETEGSKLELVFGTELVAYISLAVLCLYCLESAPTKLIMKRSAVKAGENKALKDINDSISNEFAERFYVTDRILHFCRFALMWLTLLLAITLIVAIFNLDEVHYSSFLRGVLGG